MNAKQRCDEIDVWIAEEGLPIQLRRIQKFEGLYPGDEDEREAYFDFMHWHLNQDWQLLHSIPENDDANYFQNPIIANEESAFNTIDYQRKNSQNFNKYHYRIRKVYERVKDLAILHSSVSNEEGKANIKKRYDYLIDDEFRTQRDSIILSIKRNHPLLDKDRAFEKLSELNIRINKAYSIWKKFADWE